MSLYAANCVDSEWQYVHNYTPSSPEKLQVSVHTMQDETGHLQPVLFASWKLKDDGESVCSRIQRNAVEHFMKIMQVARHEEGVEDKENWS